MRFIFIILLTISFTGIAQQDAIYSQYMFNPFVINPAYAGSRDAVNITLINRNQWVGLSGAPNTQSLSAHVPANKKNLAWGINLSHDKIGPSSSLLFMGTTAYQLKLNKGTLNFGLRGGAYNNVFDQAKLNFREEGDELDTQQKLSAIVPTFDFGIYYYTSRFFLSLSANHITKHRFNYEELKNSQANYLRRHFFISTGYVFEINNNIQLKPSVLLRYTEPNTLSADINLNMMFNELFWLGIGYRNFSSVNFLVDFNVTDYLRIGYAFDFSTQQINNYSKGSHEILIGFDFNLKKHKIISPRYL